MSLSSLLHVFNQIEQNNYRYFVVTDEDAEMVFVQNDLLDSESALNKLKNFLKESSGVFKIRIMRKKLNNPANRAQWSSNAEATYNVEVSPQNPIVTSLQGQQNQQNGLGSLLPMDDPRSNAPNIYQMMGSLGEITTQMKLMEKDHQHYREIQELRNQIAKMEEEQSKSKGMGAIADKFTSQLSDPAVLMGLISAVSGVFKKSGAVEEVVAMNGVDTEVNSNVEERRKKMVAAVNTLCQKDPNFPENIVKLSLLCQNKPDLYKMAVNYLNQL